MIYIALFVSGAQQVIQKYVYFQILLPYKLLQNIESSSYTVSMSFFVIYFI